MVGWYPDWLIGVFWFPGDDSWCFNEYLTLIVSIHSGLNSDSPGLPQVSQSLLKNRPGYETLSARLNAAVRDLRRQLSVSVMLLSNVAD